MMSTRVIDARVPRAYLILSLGPTTQKSSDASSRSRNLRVEVCAYEPGTLSIAPRRFDISAIYRTYRPAGIPSIWLPDQGVSCSLCQRFRRVQMNLFYISRGCILAQVDESHRPPAVQPTPNEECTTSQPTSRQHWPLPLL